MLGKGDQPRFRRHIVHRAAVLPPVNGRYADDAPPPLRPHIGQRQRHQLHGAEQVDLHPLAEPLHSGFLKVRCAAPPAYIVHHYINLAQGRHRFVVEPDQVVALGDVGRHRDDLHPGGGELGAGLLQLFRPPGADGDLAPLAPQRRRRLLAQPVAAPGNHCDPALQS